MNNPEPAKFRYAVAVEFELIGENAQDATNIRCELSWQENRTKIVIQENGDGNCHRVSFCLIYFPHGAKYKLSNGRQTVSKRFVFSCSTFENIVNRRPSFVVRHVLKVRIVITDTWGQ